MRNVAKKGILTVVATGSVLASTAGYAYAGAEAQGGAAGSAGVASGNSVQVPVEVPINACGNTVDVIGVLNPAYGNRCANASGHPEAAKPGGSHVGSGSHTGSGSHVGSGSHTGSGANGGTDRGSSASGASASGVAANSPGVVSGNSIQAPVHVPVNACGNSVDVVGVGNPAFGNDCANVAQPAPTPKPADDCPETHSPSIPPQVGGETPGYPRNGGPSTTPEAGAHSAPAVAPVTSGQVAPVAARTAAPVVASTPSGAVGSQLASTGAGDVELLGAAGLALLLGGGVLYRRARAGAR
ncbi:chaplin family protein [Kitasatospora sp. NPDC057940]|uniref:chaplin n=1 Tax=Kitasatospora sp. NPDC057940 TaxID=3346285 RepID=UPI0036DB3C03